jgi:hypothetical protein
MEDGIQITYISGERAGEPTIHYAYDEIYNKWCEQELKKLLNLLHKDYINKEIKIICTCDIAKKIPMLVSEHRSKNEEESNTLHIRTYPNFKNKHVNGCNFEGNSRSTPNWIENGSSIKLYFKGNPYLINKPLRNKNINIGNHTGITHDRITSYAFGKRLLQHCWNKIVVFENKVPDLKQLQEKIINVSKTMIFGRNIIMSKVLYRKGKLDQSFYIEKNNCRMFICLPFESKEDYDNEYFLIRLKNPLDQSIVCTLFARSLWEGCRLKIRDLESPYYICGWVNYKQVLISNREKFNTVEFVDAAIIPTTSLGLVVESSYERIFYEHLHSNNRLIEKPYNTKYYPSFRCMLPDGILIDTKPKTIIEIFGMTENNINYHQRKEVKKHQFNYLKRKGYFDFIYWNAYEGDTMPILPDCI